MVGTLENLIQEIKKRQLEREMEGSPITIGTFNKDVKLINTFSLNVSKVGGDKPDPQPYDEDGKQVIYGLSHRSLEESKHKFSKSTAIKVIKGEEALT